MTSNIRYEALCRTYVYGCRACLLEKAISQFHQHTHPPLDVAIINQYRVFGSLNIDMKHAYLVIDT